MEVICCHLKNLFFTLVWCGSVVRALAFTPKDQGFDSWSRAHIWRWTIGPSQCVYKRQLINMSLSPLPFPLSFHSL